MDSEKLPSKAVHVSGAVRGASTGMGDDGASRRRQVSRVQERTSETYSNDWQNELLDSLSTAQDFLKAGLISPGEVSSHEKVSSFFRVRVPRYYADLVDSSLGARCPIRKQIVPTPSEIDPALPRWLSDWSSLAFGRPMPWTNDPIGDLEHFVAPRLTHRYPSRALLHLSSFCALYCRFCFRKSHLNDKERTLYAGSLDPALEYLRVHPEIRELVLTGGDPLSVNDKALSDLFEKLQSVKSLKVVRLHSRMPVTLPHRMTDELLAILSTQTFTVTLVTHFNHPNELTPLARERLRQGRRAGLAIFNQSVLLREINDNRATLETLFTELYEEGVGALYLHHPDWTEGTMGFRVLIEQGRRLMEDLEGRLSGPAMPKYVLDLPGGFGKLNLLQNSSLQLIDSQEDSDYRARLYRLSRRPARAEAADHRSSSSRVSEYYLDCIPLQTCRN